MGRRAAALVIGLFALWSGGPSPARAGGWAVTQVDPFDQPAAGEDLEIGFTILQHGQTPVDVDGVLIVVEDPDGDTTEFPAESAGTVGRYRATIEFPESGRYHWSVIQGWFGPQDLGELDVGATGWSPPVAAWFVGPLAVAAIAGTGMVVARQRHRQPPLVSPKPQASVM
jgi:hypothetical protein